MLPHRDQCHTPSVPALQTLRIRPDSFVEAAETLFAPSAKMKYNFAVKQLFSTRNADTSAQRRVGFVLDNNTRYCIAPRFIFNGV